MKAVMASSLLMKTARVPYLLTLSDDLARVKLRDHAFEDLIDNGWQDTLVIVGTQLSVDGRQRGYVGS